MLRRLFIAATALFLLATGGAAWTYDEVLAQSYAKLFEPVAGMKTGKAFHMMKPEVFLGKVKSGTPIITLDIRTPAEMSVFGSTLPGSLTIPINELFLPDKLAQIPTDKDVVVVCASCARAMAAGTALRHIGFENVFILKGGYKALSGYLNAKNANAPPKTGQPK